MQRFRKQAERDLNEEIQAAFPDGEFETVGGFVFDLFGKLPVKYEKVSRDGFDFIVQDLEGHKINVIKVIRAKQSGDSE